MTPGLLFVVTAPSGAGKSSLIRALLAADPGVGLSVSYTTRAPRPGEQDGREYHFVDPATFAAMLERGEFLESAEVHGHRYGTSQQVIDRVRASGRDLVLVIDVQGARQVRMRCPDTVGIFVLPPSAAILERRLRGRSKDSDEQIARRLAVARSEVDEYSQYDYLVINDELDTAVERLEAIVTAERARTQRMRPKAEAIIGTFE